MKKWQGFIKIEVSLEQICSEEMLYHFNSLTEFGKEKAIKNLTSEVEEQLKNAVRKQIDCKDFEKVDITSYSKLEVREGE